MLQESALPCCGCRQYDSKLDRKTYLLLLQAQRDTGVLQPSLEDHSSNGTYVNGSLVGHDASTQLASGDRVSLVRSVTPLVELWFTFHTGVLVWRAAAFAVVRWCSD